MRTYDYPRMHTTSGPINSVNKVRYPDKSSRTPGKKLIQSKFVMTEQPN